MATKSSIAVHGNTPEMTKYSYTVMIFGERILTTATKHPEVVTEWIATVKKDHPIFRNVGFEVEFDIKTSRFGTLQLCTGNRCLVLQLDNKSPLPFSLDLFFGDQGNTFVGIHIESKFALLRSHFGFQASVAWIELAKLGPHLREKKQSEFGKMDLGKVEINWDRLPDKLSHEQVHYACLDAFFNFHLLKTRVKNIP